MNKRLPISLTKLFFTGQWKVSLFLLLSAFNSYAQQNHSIKGNVADGLNKVKISNAVVCLLSAKDSILVDFAYSDANGAYHIDKFKRGNFLLLILHPNYADQSAPILLSRDQTATIYNIELTSKINLLNEVIIKGEARNAVLRGDTIEFNAKKIVLQKNAKVEDLLKQLPNIQVDQNGKITVLGETISTVLVDGAEFFSDDPTLVTRNLRADMVDKVQLYNRKSDKELITGVGNGKKTINIQLKENSKEGYFGKLEAGSSLDGRYQGQAMGNMFRLKYKVSVFGNISNTGKLGLNNADSKSLGSVQMVQAEGPRFISNKNFNDITSNGASGIPLARSAGMHYDTQWNKNNQSVNADFSLSKVDINGQENTMSLNALPSTVLRSDADQSFRNEVSVKKLNITYQSKFSSSSSLKVIITGSQSLTSSSSSSFSANRFGTDTLVNQGNREVNSNGEKTVFKFNSFYARKFSKPGRSFSWTANIFTANDQNAGNFKSINTFFDRSGITDNILLTDQYKDNGINTSNFVNEFTWSEPLSKGLSLLFNYEIGWNKGHSDRRSFNRSASGLYAEPDARFSNDLRSDQLANQGKISLIVKKDKHIFNISNGVSLLHYHHNDRFTDAAFRRTFVNWNPTVNYTRQVSALTMLQAGYSGQNNQPTIDHLQPLNNNNDPLNVRLGNPEIRNSFSNNLSISYMSMRLVSGASYVLQSMYSNTINPIVPDITTDPAGKTTYRFVNADRNASNLMLAAMIMSKVKSLGMILALKPNFTNNINFGMTNGTLDKRNTQNYDIDLTINKTVASKYEFMAGGGPGYQRSISSLQSQANNNGWQYKLITSLTRYLPFKTEFSTFVRADFQSKTKAFREDLSVFLLDASISKKFLKGDNLKLSVSGNDLLNQNNGFSRTSLGNTVTQNNYTTIKRYIFYSLKWDFSNMSKASN
ncbi:outer membrane beta-barrel protein [Pedobacter metabolipauper]|uniref:Outer membrane receptor protein involved in Fe transport n=1 Tax=Pedobacter metabolipauper TaxID=425513 RepID=A0A4R6SQB6_9SPHI|nr:outer membrane beta-barrel protein [Pedobacter metabolipauper]TDQ06959.1 outer membrane receptor protein involved in Fe transport [Pedobacter metabolipauper]